MRQINRYLCITINSEQHVLPVLFFIYLNRVIAVGCVGVGVSLEGLSQRVQGHFSFPVRP